MVIVIITSITVKKQWVAVKFLDDQILSVLIYLRIEKLFRLKYCVSLIGLHFLCENLNFLDQTCKLLLNTRQIHPPFKKNFARNWIRGRAMISKEPRWNDPFLH